MLHEVHLSRQQHVDRRVLVRHEPPDDARDRRRGAGRRLQPERLAAHPLGHAVGAAPYQVGESGVTGPLVTGDRGPYVRRQDPHVPGRVVQLFGIRPGKPDEHRGGVLRRRCHLSLEHGARLGVERGVRVGGEGEHHVGRRHRHAVLPRGARSELEAPGQAVDPFPSFGESGPVPRRFDRRGAGSEVGKSLEYLVGDVAPDRLEDQRREERRRLAGGGDDHGTAFRARRRRLTHAAGEDWWATATCSSRRRTCRSRSGSRPRGSPSRRSVR